ncbi:hypothetical protein E1091_14535 [Micromonospora fluostatini]|uniref:Uncharacterized protein n=1 Tax=Micromonospora fluostatini TaxID=1629071 RepID=A0ABY2DEH1_9ACTN|nr:hypothetical protein E1091_14535 [Micromonospora fluostatini]
MADHAGEELSGRARRPYWLKRPCPPWCIATHEDADDIEDRIHWPDESPPVLLSLHSSVRTAGESCAHQAYRPRQLEIDLEQHVDAVEPVVKFVIEGAAAVLRLTLDEAEEVRTAIGQVATVARDGGNQPASGARSPASPAAVPDRGDLGWVVFDRVVQDEGLTADQKISVLRGVVAEQLTRQDLSLPEQAAELNCTEDQVADAMVDFATWSHAGYLLPPTTSTESPCPVWCDGTCLFEDGVRLHNRHVLAVHGQDVEAADGTKVATVDLEAFNAPDGQGDEPPSVTLTINNPEQRTADYSKLDGLDPATVRSLAASLLSGCWEGAAVRFNPEKAAELGASLIAAARATSGDMTVRT